MKKIIITLLALIGTMSMNAQAIKIYKGDKLVAKYDAWEGDRVVFDNTPSTTGIATRTGDIGVRWIQLWEGGPKFAEYNVAGTMTFTEASKTGTDYIWGANWRTPGKDELNELVKAAQGKSGAKVACEYMQVDGVWGFNFKGKEDDYAGNSVFFPVMDGNDSRGVGMYLSGTPNGSSAWSMLLSYSGDTGYYGLMASGASGDCFVRPVLDE